MSFTGLLYVEVLNDNKWVLARDPNQSDECQHFAYEKHGKYYGVTMYDFGFRPFRVPYRSDLWDTFDLMPCPELLKELGTNAEEYTETNGKSMWNEDNNGIMLLSFGDLAASIRKYNTKEWKADEVIALGKMMTNAIQRVDMASEYYKRNFDLETEARIVEIGFPA